MTMHRADVSVHLHLPGIVPDPAPTESTACRGAGADTAVSEWTIDLVAPPMAATLTSVGATGYVDFDALESVHGPSRPPQP